MQMSRVTYQVLYPLVVPQAPVLSEITVMEMAEPCQTHQAGHRTTPSAGQLAREHINTKTHKWLILVPGTLVTKITF